MENYKTKINVNLNGAGELYYVNQSCDEVVDAFEQSSCVMFKNAAVYGREIELLVINPSNCASVEVFKNESYRGTNETSN